MIVARPIPAHESSGRHLGTRHVARRFGVSPARVRAMVAEGLLVPAHVLPAETPHEPPVYIFHADYIAERVRARDLRLEGRARLDQALGFAPHHEDQPCEVQGVLPLGGRG